MVQDIEMPGPSNCSTNCQNQNDDEEMSSLATTTTTNDQTDTLPKRVGLEAGQNQMRKKRFSSRNYRNHLGPNVDKVK